MVTIPLRGAFPYTVDCKGEGVAVDGMTLIYDPDQEGLVRDKLLPRFVGHEVTALPYDAARLPDVPAQAILLTWLDDAALAQLMPEVLVKGWALGLLPHPGLRQARLGFGVANRLEEAVDALLAADAPIEVDLLQCNGEPVFNSVVIGDPFMLTPGTAATEGVWARLRRFARLAKGLGATTLRPFKLTTRKEKTIDTAALGMVAVERGRSSAITRRLLGDASVNDGMLHLLVLAPRSVLEMTGLLLRALFLGGLGNAARLPEFVGHIKTEGIRIGSSKPVGYAVDGIAANAQDLELSIAPRALRLIPSGPPEQDQHMSEAKEVFRVQSLPTGEAVQELVSRPLPWIHHAATEEFKELFLILRENARTSESYLVLTLLSTLLATVGLFANSAPVIIGAMILAPLMAPIISVSMGVLRQQEQLLVESAKAVAAGILLALGCATLLTWITPLYGINSEIAARLSPTLLDLGVAVISGIAGAYAHARSEVARSLAGVAIAVALVPPLSVAGIGIGWGEWPVFWGAFLLFVTNLVGIVLAAASTFLWMGYSPFGRAKRGLVWSLLLVGVVSIPLAAGFQRMVDEHRIVQALDGWETSGVRLRDVEIRSTRPLYLSVRLLADGAFDSARIETVKREIEQRLGREIVLEASIALVY